MGTYEHSDTVILANIHFFRMWPWVIRDCPWLSRTRCLVIYASPDIDTAMIRDCIPRDILGLLRCLVRLITLLSSSVTNVYNELISRDNRDIQRGDYVTNLFITNTYCSFTASLFFFLFLLFPRCLLWRIDVLPLFHNFLFELSLSITNRIMWNSESYKYLANSSVTWT